MGSSSPASSSDYLLSVVVPCHNEQENIQVLYDALVRVLDGTCRFELLLIDDGSTDQTLLKIRELSQRDRRVRYISFSRNFGHQAAIKAGIDASTGDCLVMLDADLQHPPEFIPTMLKEWQAGHKIVYTRRDSNEGYPWFKRLTTGVFYRLMAGLTDVRITGDSADFRLIDKDIVNIIRPIQDNFLFLRGLLPWLGFPGTTLVFSVQPRHAGKTKYSLGKMLSLAMNGITSFSIRPLRLASLLGIFISLLAFIYGLYAIYLRLFTTTTIPGWTSVLVAVLFIGGIQLIVIGIIGEYLGKLFLQQKSRPAYVIKEKSS